jgi:hypothetical protein
MNDIYNLKLHEVMTVSTKGDGKMDIIRVPGGWIYVVDFPGYRQAPSVFVPFQDEFRPIPPVDESVTKPLKAKKIK